MIQFFEISDDNWPFDGVLNWKKVLHTWIAENVDDPSNQELMHKRVSAW